MLRSYWGTVARRAFRETREILRVESRARLVISIAITALVIVVLIFWGSEDAATDEIIVRSVIAATVVLAFPFVYVWRFVNVPAEMESLLETDLGQKITNLETTVATLKAQSAKNTAITLTSSSLSVLIERGLRLTERRIAIEGMPKWTEESDTWKRSCLAFLGTGISHQDAVAFNTIVYDIRRKFRYKINDNHNNLLNEMTARVSLLQNINDRYKDHWITMTPEWRAIVESYLTKSTGA